MHCPNCGAVNPEGAERCANCGAPLPQEPDDETLIDVSGSRPRIVPVDEQAADEGGFWPRHFPQREYQYHVGPSRVFTIGGNRTCLLLLLVVALLFCCSCWALANLFNTGSGLFEVNWF